MPGLQSSGAISLKDIEDEFFGDGPIPISDYIRGGTYVKQGSTANADIPTSTSNIQFSDFHGAANVYETIALAQGSTITGEDEGAGGSGPPSFGWVYFFVWSDGTDTFVSSFTYGDTESTYDGGDAGAGSYDGFLIYTVNLGGNYYCKATATTPGSYDTDVTSGSTLTVHNDFTSYTQITTGTEAASKYYSIRTYANADSNNPSAWAESSGRLTFDFNSDGGTNAELSIYWDYYAAASSDYEQD